MRDLGTFRRLFIEPAERINECWNVWRREVSEKLNHEEFDDLRLRVLSVMDTNRMNAILATSG